MGWGSGAVGETLTVDRFYSALKRCRACWAERLDGLRPKPCSTVELGCATGLGLPVCDPGPFFRFSFSV